MAFPSRGQFSPRIQPSLGALLPRVNTSNNEESSLDSEDVGIDPNEPLINVSDNDSEDESDSAANDGQSSIESEDTDVDQTHPLNDVPDNDSEEGLLYSDSEVEDEGCIGSSILYEQYEEAQIGKSNERVEILEEEMSSIYRLLQAERRESSNEISALMQELLDEIGQAELSRMSIHDSITDDALQSQNSDFQERIGVLESQLQTLRRENTALSRKVGALRESAPGRANMQGQYVQYLQRENAQLLQKLGEQKESSRTQAAEQATQLQQTVREQQAVIEQKEQQIFKLTRKGGQAFDHSDRSELSRADDSAAPPAISNGMNYNPRKRMSRWRGKRQRLRRLMSKNLRQNSLNSTQRHSACEIRSWNTAIAAYKSNTSNGKSSLRSSWSEHQRYSAMMFRNIKSKRGSKACKKL